jgi:hypothetical protein
MEYDLTEHARDALSKRQIRQEWLEKALAAPEWTETDSVDERLEHRLVRIAEFGDRVLRVVVDVRLVPERVVTAYFDRRRRDR